LTHVTNKHLLPVYNKPMIFYPIQTLVSAGVTDILIVTSGPHVGDFLGVLKTEKNWGDTSELHIRKTDGGIADALGLAERFTDEIPLRLFWDNTTDADIRPAVKNFKDGAVVFSKRFRN